jgi:hypothetical protein
MKCQQTTIKQTKAESWLLPIQLLKNIEELSRNDFDEKITNLH